MELDHFIAELCRLQSSLVADVVAEDQVHHLTVLLPHQLHVFLYLERVQDLANTLFSWLFIFIFIRYDVTIVVVFGLVELLCAVNHFGDFGPCNRLLLIGDSS